MAKPIKYKRFSYNFSILLVILFFGELCKPSLVYANRELKQNFQKHINQIPRDDFYIIGPGDMIKIEVSEETDILNKTFIVDGEGMARLKRLNRIYASGLTVEELTEVLNTEYLKYIKNPNVKLTILKYRPVKVYISGEVENPGYYVLKGNYREVIGEKETSNNISSPQEIMTLIEPPLDLFYNNFFPSLFYAINKSGGVSINADLKKVVITRKNSISAGGGRVRTNLNLINTITKYDLSQNIRILDGDTIFVSRSETPLIEEIAKASQTNLNPKFINIYLSGRVNKPGNLNLNKGAALNEAIEIGGGTKVIKGKAVFLRYNPDGSIERRKFSLKKSAPRGSYKNPYLKSGDFIYIEKGPFTASTEVLQDISSPFQSLISTYGLYKVLTGD